MQRPPTAPSYPDKTLGTEGRCGMSGFMEGRAAGGGGVAFFRTHTTYCSCIKQRVGCGKGVALSALGDTRLALPVRKTTKSRDRELVQRKIHANCSVAVHRIVNQE